MKYTAITLAVLMTVAPAAAQNTQPQTNPGLITPDIPVAWQADQFFDSITKNPGEIAEERASEAAVMINEDKPNAARRAVQALDRTSQQANKNHTEGLENAERILSEVRVRTPDEANVGIDTALNNIREAKNREPPTPQGQRPGNIFDRNNNQRGVPNAR